MLGIRNSRDDPICRVRKLPPLVRWTAPTTGIQCLFLANKRSSSRSDRGPLFPQLLTFRFLLVALTDIDLWWLCSRLRAGSAQGPGSYTRFRKSATSIL